MDPLARVLVYTAAAGAGIPLGGLLSSVPSIGPDWLKREFRHGVMAFGGGILVAAVALVLVPEGVRAVPTWAALASFVAGGFAFMVVDRALARRGTHASLLLAALLDFAPEAIALGAAMAVRPSLGVVLTIIIALQNVPEGFNAHREMVAAGRSSRRVVGLLAVLALVGPACGALGFMFLGDAPRVTGVLMLFAAGGILYLTFQDIAPQVRLENHWAPAAGAVLGFAAGLAGALLVG
jgi:ZIP family zinc transporter